MRSPWLTQDYRGQAEASDALWAGGWLHTQDIARLSAHGEIQIVDRLKDLIKSGGEWLSSGQLETLALEHQDISQVAFVGVADARWGERPAAAVVLASGADAQAAGEMLRAHLRRYVEDGVISAYALPERVRIVAQLPLTSVGKIDKKAVRTLLESVEI